MNVLNIVVQSGTMTFYAPFGSGCRAREYGPGSPIVEFPGDARNPRNEGSQPLVFLIFTSFPAGTSDRIDQPKPPDCPV